MTFSCLKSQLAWIKMSTLNLRPPNRDGPLLQFIGTTILMTCIAHPVDQLRHLGSWLVNSGVVHLYMKKIIEQYSDSAGLITPGRYMSLKLHMRIRERYGL